MLCTTQYQTSENKTRKTVSQTTVCVLWQLSHQCWSHPVGHCGHIQLHLQCMTFSIERFQVNINNIYMSA